MNLLDLLTVSILSALGCDMTSFLLYFPAAGTMYSIFVGIAMGLLLLNLVWQLTKNFGAGIGVEAEDPLKLTLKSILFMFFVYYSDDIIQIALDLGGTPYNWILSSDLPPIRFGDFYSSVFTIIGTMVNGSIALISLILVIIMAWNYLKLLLEAAQRYVLLGVLVFTAPVAISLGASQATSNIFKSWCRMVAGQMFLLLMNAWCLKLFIGMMSKFLADPF